MEEQEVFNKDEGYMLINNGNRQNNYIISSNVKMFKNEYVIVDVFHDHLILKLPTIDYNGKLYKTTKNKSTGKWRQFGIRNEKLITGKFKIDTEDSTEDELVVYFE